MAGILGILPLLTAGDLLLADRGFCSLAHLALLMSKRAHAVFRLHQKQIVDFTPGRPCPAPQEASHQGDAAQPLVVGLRVDGSSGRIFQDVRHPKWISEEEYQALPESIIVRELRYRIIAPGFRTQR